MSASGFILGVINIGIAAALLLLLGLVIEWLAVAFKNPTTPEMRKFYLLFVLLVVIYMVVALVLGLPTWRVL